MLPISISDQPCTEGLHFWKKTRKINEKFRRQRGGNKTRHFADDTTVYIGKPKEPTDKLLKLLTVQQG